MNRIGTLVVKFAVSVLLCASGAFGQSSSLNEDWAKTYRSDGFTGFGAIRLSSYAIRSDEMLSITCWMARAVRPGVKLYVRVAGLGMDWDSVGAARWEGTFASDTDVVELHFVVKLRKSRGQIYSKSLPAGVVMSIVPESDPNYGHEVLLRPVTILDKDALNEQSQAIIRQDSIEAQKRRQLYYDWRDAQPPEPYPYRSEYLERWKKYYLEHFPNDTSGLYNTWGLPKIPPAERTPQGKQEGMHGSGSSIRS